MEKKVQFLKNRLFYACLLLCTSSCNTTTDITKYRYSEYFSFPLGNFSIRSVEFRKDSTFEWTNEYNFIMVCEYEKTKGRWVQEGAVLILNSFVQPPFHRVETIDTNLNNNDTITIELYDIVTNFRKSGYVSLCDSKGVIFDVIDSDSTGVIKFKKGTTTTIYYHGHVNEGLSSYNLPFGKTYFRIYSASCYYRSFENERFKIKRNKLIQVDTIDGKVIKTVYKKRKK